MKNLEISALLDLRHTLAAEYLARFCYPWEALSGIKDIIVALQSQLDPSVYDELGDGVFVAKSATVAKSASITGPCIIGEETEVRHCAFIRDSALIGKNCVVGNSTELKNVILFDNVQVPHYNYVGDSILGYRSHMGAGSITSNVKSDKTNVTVRCGEEKIETGLKKFGAVLGDEVEIGCGSVLNPGTIIGKSSNVYPLSSVRGFVPSGHIYKSQGEIAQKRV